MIRDLFEGWHVVLLVVAFVLLFGSRRLPEGARALGRSLRIFKAEVRGLSDDSADPAAAADPAVSAAPAASAMEAAPPPLAAAPVAPVPAAGVPVGVTMDPARAASALPPVPPAPPTVS